MKLKLIIYLPDTLTMDRLCSLLRALGLTVQRVSEDVLLARPEPVSTLAPIAHQRARRWPPEAA